MSRADWKRPKVVMPEGLRRIKIVVSYDGRFYHGWQKQDGAITVQEEIEKVIFSTLGENVFVQGSGRTDASVHALGQVAHFDTKSNIKAETFAIILNSKLPKTIRVLSSSEPEDVFHARFTAMSREYWYLIKEYKDYTSFDWGRVAPYKRVPDITLLNEYASILQGTHDYTTFCSSRDISVSKVRDIYVSQWSKEKDIFGYDIYKYKVVGNAFLYHQVRSMVGSMVEAALKGESKEAFKLRLDSKNRENALRTAQPEGLYLARISYDEEEYRWFEELENGK